MQNNTMANEIDIRQEAPVPPPQPVGGRKTTKVNHYHRKPVVHTGVTIEPELFDVLQRLAIKQRTTYGHVVDRALRAYLTSQNIPVPLPDDRYAAKDGLLPNPYYTGPSEKKKPSAYAKEFPYAKTEHKMIWVPKKDWRRLMAWAQRYGLSNSTACCNAIAAFLHREKVPLNAKPDPNLPLGRKRFEYRKWKTDHTPKYIKNGTKKTAGRAKANEQWIEGECKPIQQEDQ